MAFKKAFRWAGLDDDRLAKSARGGIEPALDNVVLILRNDPAWHDVIAHNEFSGMVTKRATPPFEVAELGEWTDMDDARLELWLCQHYGIRRVSESVLQRGVALAADANRYHEVKEFLNGLTWDGNHRLKVWLSAYLGAEDNEYTSLVGIKYLVGAVARIMRSPMPVKVDNLIILEGAQGAGKSSAFKILFSPWFTDAAFEIGSTDGYQIIRGMWGVELAELDGFNRAEASKSKAFFSRDQDRYRSPYGRKPINIVRQCVFGGSVNHAAYLKDDSGNRRYWPISVGRIDLPELAEDRDQLWAEALHEYNEGTVWHVRAAEASLFEDAQDQRYIGDAYEEKIVAWLDGKADIADQKKNEASTSEIMGKALHLDTGKWTLAEQQRVGRIMARIGWKRRKVGARESRQWNYFRPEVEG